MRRSRMLGWDRNPLRRRIDRVEAAMLAGLIAVFLISAPVLAAVAGHWTADVAGGSVRVRVTRSGSLTGPPLRHSQIQAHIALAELAAVLVLGLLLCLAGGAGRVLLARRRLADWNKGWRVVEPRWSRKS